MKKKLLKRESVGSAQIKRVSRRSLVVSKPSHLNSVCGTCGSETTLHLPFYPKIELFSSILSADKPQITSRYQR
jgi:hypothetical protein